MSAPDERAALDAEIAPHRMFDFGMAIDGGRYVENICCRACFQPWPCLVRRLADEVGAALERGAYVPSSKGLTCRYCHAIDYGISPRGRDTYEVIHRESCVLARRAPAGEGKEAPDERA